LLILLFVTQNKIHQNIWNISSKKRFLFLWGSKVQMKRVSRFGEFGYLALEEFWNGFGNCFKGHYHPKKLFLHRTRYRPKTWLVCRFWHAEEDSDEIFWVWPSVSMETVKQWDFGSCLVEHPIFEPPSLWLYFCHKMFPIMQNYGLIYFFSFKVALFMKKW